MFLNQSEHSNLQELGSNQESQWRVNSAHEENYADGFIYSSADCPYLTLENLLNALGLGGYYYPLNSLLDLDGSTEQTSSTIDFGNSSSTSTQEVTYNLTYDANGNVIEGFGFYFDYNDANQLWRVRNSTSGATIAKYYYNPNGIRFKKNESGTVTYYIGNHFETKLNPDGSTENTSYYFANGERVAKKDNSGDKYYYHQDHLGSTNLITDSSGDSVETTKYLPFGDIRSGGSSNKFYFTGKEEDAETGLYYYGARYYSPEVRRWVQADPQIPDIYNPQGLNRYSYTLNNPLVYIDPTGEYYAYVYQYSSPVIPLIIYFPPVALVVGASAAFVYCAHQAYVATVDLVDYVNYLTATSSAYPSEDESEYVNADQYGYGYQSSTGPPTKKNGDTDRKGKDGDTTLSNKNLPKDITSKWHKGTFKTVEKSIRYHFGKHGAEVGTKTVKGYTQKGLEFYAKHKDIGMEYTLKTSEKGLEIISGGLRGVYTESGKLVTFHKYIPK